MKSKSKWMTWMWNVSNEFDFNSSVGNHRCARKRIYSIMSVRYWKKICPSGHRLASLGRVSWCLPSVTLGTDFSISISHSWKILIFISHGQVRIFGQTAMNKGSIWENSIHELSGILNFASQNCSSFFQGCSKQMTICWKLDKISSFFSGPFRTNDIFENLIKFLMVYFKCNDIVCWWKSSLINLNG